jgi:pimeloyl-ACP methyl ester carboxylesterase
VTVSTPQSTTRTVELLGGLTITVDEYGDAAAADGAGALVLHGGAGPRSVAGFAAALAEHTYVIVPTHPGFDGTPRPESTDTIGDLATAYLDLIEALGLDSAMVIGNSVGGWIAAEMGLRDNTGRITALVLMASTGITPEPPLEIADPSKLGPARTSELAFHNPRFRLNPATMTDQQRAGMVANQGALAVYASLGHDPKLRGRLHRVTVPVLVLAGEQDGIVPLEYERVLADSFPRGTFRCITEAGHFPQIEQPGQVFAAIGDFVDTEVKPDEN